MRPLPASAFSGGLLGTLKPNGPLPLRAEPPGIFKGKGHKLGVAKPTEQYLVLEQRDIPTVLGCETWYRVQNKEEPSKNGWIYIGPSSLPQANVQIAE
jgi:hypothetical protein